MRGGEVVTRDELQAKAIERVLSRVSARLTMSAEEQVALKAAARALRVKGMLVKALEAAHFALTTKVESDRFAPRRIEALEAIELGLTEARKP